MVQAQDAGHGRGLGGVRRTIAACTGDRRPDVQPDRPADHVRAIVDEIETEIGDEPGGAEALIEGSGRHDGDNGRVEAAVRQILLEIGEDPDRQGLLGTPARVRRMYAELTAGYHVDPDRLVNNAIFDVDYSEMVVVKDIPFYRLCEHHLLPFFGPAAVAYIPEGRVIGLSKIPRIVEMYARRLQVQERMTKQIADFLMERLEPQGRRRRRRGVAPVRGHARRAQAGHDHDHVVTSSGCSGPPIGRAPSSSTTSNGGPRRHDRIRFTAVHLPFEGGA